MISSMTGFGRATVASDGREITIELKSVNHRYLDLAFRSTSGLLRTCCASSLQGSFRAAMSTFL